MVQHAIKFFFSLVHVGMKMMNFTKILRTEISQEYELINVIKEIIVYQNKNTA